MTVDILDIMWGVPGGDDGYSGYYVGHSALTMDILDIMWGTRR